MPFHNPVGEPDPGTSDLTTETHFPIKLDGVFKNGPLHWSGVPGDPVISDETLQVPQESIQVGEGLTVSAAGVIPIFISQLTGIKYIPTMFIYDELTGSEKPFTLDISTPATLIVQPVFSTSTPLSGMFTNTVTSSAFINSLGVKTDALATLTDVRLELVAQSTGEPIFYFPSKAAWNAGIGEDLTADASGDIVIDLGEAPLGLLVGEVIDVNYVISSGVLYGDGAIPYQELVRQLVTFVDLATIADAPDIGEIKMVALSLSGAVTKIALKEKGWAVCDGTSSVSQGIIDPIILTTPNLEDKFIRGSSDETSGTTGGVDQNSISWTSRSVDDDGTTVVGRIEGTTSGTKVFDNKPPFYELAFFIKVK